MVDKKISKKTLLTILISVIAAVILVFSYNFYNRLKEPVVPAIDAIPASAALVFEWKNSPKAWNDLSNNGLWKSLSKIKLFNKLTANINYLDSVFIADSKAIDILEDNSMFLSLHYGGNNNFDFLFLVNLPNARQRSYIKSFFDSEQIIEKRSFKGAKIYETILNNKREKFFFTAYKGIFIGSFSSILIENSIKQLNNGKSIAKDPGFIKINKTAGAKVDGNMFFNFKFFYRILSKYSHIEHRENLANLASFGWWTGLDITIKNEAILFNGFTLAPDSLNLYLNVFKDQPAPEMQLTSILPANTAFFIYYGFDNFKGYFKNYQNFIGDKKTYNYKREIQKLNDRFKTNIESDILSWIGNEMALVITNPKSQNIKNCTYAIFKTNDNEKALNKLNNLCSKVKSGSVNYDADETYKNFNIKHLDIPVLLPLFFGPLFQKMERSYFILIDNYIVFGNTKSALKDFINVNGFETTLPNDNSYKALSENMSGKSNLYIYCKPLYSLNIAKKYIYEDFFNSINDNFAHIKNIETIGIQYEQKDEILFTNICFKYSSANIAVDTNISFWETSIDTSIAGKPHFVTDHTDKSLKIIVFDILNNMYLLDFSGNIRWKTSLEEPLIGDIHIVDYYKNNKYQYLFNTKNYIYLIDLKGNMVENFPFKLPSSASNPMAVFDYEKRKNYRILINCDDKKTYNFNIKTKQVQGWNIPLSKKSVVKPVEYLNMGNKDYIIIPDSDGDIVIYDRRGVERIKVDEHINNSPKSKFYTDNAKQRIITSNKNGNIVKISARGFVEILALNSYSENHHFIFEDFNKDGQKDYIFLDDKILNIFGDDNKEIYIYEFSEEIIPEILCFYLTNHGTVLGFNAKNSDNIFLLNSDGLIKESANFKGNTPFIIGKTEDEQRLITGSGTFLYSYLLDLN